MEELTEITLRLVDGAELELQGERIQVVAAEGVVSVNDYIAPDWITLAVVPVENLASLVRKGALVSA